MQETVITVRGTHTGRYAPEHAVVTGAVALDGADRESVFAAATEVSARLTATLDALLNETAGPVIRWSAQTLRVWSERPWNNPGEQLPLVFHAELAFSATFTDPDALARWVEQQATVEGVAIHGISWGLSEESERAAQVEVRAAAVADAVERAAAYASSLGLGAVHPVAIADPGMLGDSGSGADGASPMMMKAAMDSVAFSSGASLEFRPQDLELSASVDARFLAN